jgi:hypothetical protein
VKTILSLYDYTGNWSLPYREAGYTVIQVDLQHGKDARLVEYHGEKVHGILAAPPCTVFASSGARWPRTDQDYAEALALVDCVMRYVYLYKPKFWVMENPVGKLVRWIGEPRLRFDPCEFGDNYTKKTCLWGEFNIPERTPVPATEGSKMNTQYGGKSQRTKNARSATPMGFAQAFFRANP